MEIPTVYLRSACIAAMAAIVSWAPAAEAGWLAQVDDSSITTETTRVSAFVEGTDPMTMARYWLVAFTYNDGPNNGTALLRLDEDYSIAWQRRYASTIIDDLRETSTAGTFIGIGNGQGPNGIRPLAFTIDGSGAIGWSNVYLNTPDPTVFPGAEFDKFNGVLVDGTSYVLVGNKNYLQGDGFVGDMWMLKLDASGAVTWQHTIGYDGVFNLEPLEQESGLVVVPSAGGYMFLGSTNASLSTPNGNGDVLMVELDTAGNLLSERAFGTLSDDFGIQIVPVGNDFIVAGTTRHGPEFFQNDYLMLRIDSTLTPVWSNIVAFGGIEFPLGIATVGSEVFVTGTRTSTNFGSAILTKFSSAGAHLGTWSFGVGGDLSNVVSAPGNELVVAGIVGASAAREVLVSQVDANASTGGTCAPIAVLNPTFFNDASADVLSRNTTMNANGRFLPSAVTATPIVMIDTATSYASTALCGTSAIGVSPASIAFAPTAVGSSDLGTVTIDSLGANALNVTSVGPDDGTHFSVTGGTCPATPFSLAPASSCTIEVAFAPMLPAPVSTTLRIESDDPAAPLSSVALDGQGLPAPRQLDVSPAALAFGETPGSMTVTLASTGLGDVTVTTLSVDDGTHFSIDGGSCGAAPFSLSPASTCTVDVVFAPMGDGPYADNLVVASNDDDDVIQTVELLGAEGMEPPPPPPEEEGQLTFAPGSFDFSAEGMPTLSSAPVERFELRNDSENAATLASLSLQGDGAFSLATNSGCLLALEESGGAGIVVPPGKSCRFSVAFAPNAEGGFAGSVVADAPNAIAAMSLSGQATAAAPMAEEGGCSLAARPAPGRGGAWWMWAGLSAVGLWRRRRA
jgi:hypothetical protein